MLMGKLGDNCGQRLTRGLSRALQAAPALSGTDDAMASYSTMSTCQTSSWSSVCFGPQLSPLWMPGLDTVSPGPGDDQGAPEGPRCSASTRLCLTSLGSSAACPWVARPNASGLVCLVTSSLFGISLEPES